MSGFKFVRTMLEHTE